jgi:hypothetical protein
MDELEVAAKLKTEILNRFPEVEPFCFEGIDDGLSYIIVGYLADWLETVPDCSSNADIVRRLNEFFEWVKGQPSGDDASNDILTIFTVAFLEDLFESANLVKLIPYIFSREDLTASKDYWITFVGAMNYQFALNLFDKDHQKSNNKPIL